MKYEYKPTLNEDLFNLINGFDYINGYTALSPELAVAWWFPMGREWKPNSYYKESYISYRNSANFFIFELNNEIVNFYDLNFWEVPNFNLKTMRSMASERLSMKPSYSGNIKDYQTSENIHNIIT